MYQHYLMRLDDFLGFFFGRFEISLRAKRIRIITNTFNGIENFYYWYGKVEGDLRNDLNPSKNLWVDPDSQKAYGLYMWLSEGEVGPNLHYDQDHNFFVQINGT
jgi:hypothetical protein